MQKLFLELFYVLRDYIRVLLDSLHLLRDGILYVTRANR